VKPKPALRSKWAIFCLSVRLKVTVGGGVAVGEGVGIVVGKDCRGDAALGFEIGAMVGVGEGLEANEGGEMGVEKSVAVGSEGGVDNGVTIMVSSTRVHAARSGPSIAAESPRAEAPFINWRRVSLEFSIAGDLLGSI
jgi:hypothetical protein